MANLAPGEFFIGAAKSGAKLAAIGAAGVPF